MSRERFESLIQELGKAVDMELNADDTGYCCLEIDGSLLAHMQYVAASDSIYIFSELGRIEDHALASACERLLAANLFGVETGGGVLAMHGDSHELVFSYSVSATEENPVRFQQILENVIHYAEYWKGELESMNRASPVPGEADDPRLSMLRV